MSKELSDMNPEELIDEIIREAVDAGKFERSLEAIAERLIEEVLEKIKQEIDSIGAELRTNPPNCEDLHEDRRRLRKLEEEIPKKIRSQPNEFVKKIAEQPAIRIQKKQVG